MPPPASSSLSTGTYRRWHSSSKSSAGAAACTKTWAKAGSPSSTSDAPPNSLPTKTSTAARCRSTSPRRANPWSRPQPSSTPWNFPPRPPLAAHPHGPPEPPRQAPPGRPPGAPGSPMVPENLRGDIRSKLLKRFDSLAQFLQTWQQAERKTTLLQELQAYGIPLNALAAPGVAADTGLQNLDPFDLLLHVAYDQPMLTRRERAARVKKRKPFSSYGPMARKVLQALLDKYADEGITTIESSEVFRIQPFTNLGSPVELVRSFGGRPQYQAALQTLVREIYRAG